MDNIWIIGAGGIAIEYAKVLKALGRDFIVIGRGETSARKFKDAIGVQPILGGLEEFLKTSPVVPDKVINCVRAFELGKVNIVLMNYGVPCILSEKPGFYPDELNSIINKPDIYHLTILRDNKEIEKDLSARG